MQGERVDFQQVMMTGHAFAWSGQWQNAADEYRRALSVAPEDDKARVALAMCLVNLGNQAEAAEHLAAASSAQPQNHLLLGKRVELLVSLDRPAEAASVLVELGDRVAADGRDSEAMHHWRRAVELAPADENAHLRLLTAYLQSGDLDRATIEQQAVNELRREAGERAEDLSGGVYEQPAETDHAEPDFTAEEAIAFVERTLAEQARTAKAAEPEPPAEVDERAAEEEARAEVETMPEVLVPEEEAAPEEPALREVSSTLDPEDELEATAEAATSEQLDPTGDEIDRAEVESAITPPAAEAAAIESPTFEVTAAAPTTDIDEVSTEETIEPLEPLAEPEQAVEQTGDISVDVEPADREPLELAVEEPVEYAEAALTADLASPAEAEALPLPAENDLAVEPAVLQAPPVAPQEQELPQVAKPQEPRGEAASAVAQTEVTKKKSSPWWQSALKTIGLSSTPAFEDEIDEEESAEEPAAAAIPDDEVVDEAPKWAANEPAPEGEGHSRLAGALKAIGLSTTPAFEADLETAADDLSEDEAPREPLAAEADEITEPQVAAAALDSDELGMVPAEESPESESVEQSQPDAPEAPEQPATTPEAEAAERREAAPPAEAEERAPESEPAPVAAVGIWQSIDQALSERRIIAAFDLQRQAVGQVLAGTDAEIKAAVLTVPGVDGTFAREALELPREQREPALLALARADALRKHGLNATARDECERAIVIAPGYLPLQISLARTYEALGRQKAAHYKYECIADVYEIRGNEAEAGRIRELARTAA